MVLFTGSEVPPGQVPSHCFSGEFPPGGPAGRSQDSADHPTGVPVWGRRGDSHR